MILKTNYPYKIYFFLLSKAFQPLDRAIEKVICKFFNKTSKNATRKTLIQKRFNQNKTQTLHLSSTTQKKKKRNAQIKTVSEKIPLTSTLLPLAISLTFLFIPIIHPTPEMFRIINQEELK